MGSAVRGGGAPPPGSARALSLSLSLSLSHTHTHTQVYKLDLTDLPRSETAGLLTDRPQASCPKFWTSVPEQ